MTESSPSPRGLRRLFRRKRNGDPFTPWEEIRRQETDASMAVLKQRRKRERQQHSLGKLISYWPVLAGLVLSLYSQPLENYAQSLGPWAMTLLFPFVLVARRPEVWLSGSALPTIVLYAQFPAEGLFARAVLKRGLKPLNVVGQVSLFHLLGILELVMLTDVPRRLLAPR